MSRRRVCGGGTCVRDGQMSMWMVGERVLETVR